MKKVIAIDFDGTLFENKWPEIGMPIAQNINRAKNEKENGAVLILWTCREEEKLAEALAASAAASLLPVPEADPQAARPSARVPARNPAIHF